MCLGSWPFYWDSHTSHNLEIFVLGCQCQYQLPWSNFDNFSRESPSLYGFHCLGNSKMSILYALEWGQWSFHAQLNICFYHTSLWHPLFLQPAVSEFWDSRDPRARLAPFAYNRLCTSSRKWSLSPRSPVASPPSIFQLPELSQNLFCS